ncbi:MAG: hypothetical protein QW796_06325 [Thermoproteota archaeon]
MKKLYILIPLDIGLERETLYEKLKHYINVCEKVLEDPHMDYDTKLKAATVLAQLTARAGKILTEIQLDEIHKMIEELEGKVKHKG